MQAFSEILLDEIITSRKNNYTDNFDPNMRYDPKYSADKKSLSIKQIILNKNIPITAYLKASRTLFHALNPRKFYQSIIARFANFPYLYDLLQDSQSKQLFIKLLAYKILGYKKVKLPRNNSAYWQTIKEIEKLDVGYGNLKISFVNLNLLLLDLLPLGYDIRANVTPAGAAAIFAQKQYEYRSHDVVIKAEKGDVVIDCGACWGETSLYFAHEVGNTGKVFSFEFIPENMDIFKTNISHNPHLKNNIEIVPHPVWHKSNETLFYADHGPGSSVRESANNDVNVPQCKTMSIDDLVTQKNLDRVNFIKMDIEGSELNALRGAEQTIRKYKPKLAISVYHKDDDFITIPEYLNELGLGYKFYLDHHTIHYWETVLYAVAAE